MMKHKKLIILSLIFMCVMITAIVTNTPEQKTIRYFNSHRAALEDAVLHHMGAGLTIVHRLDANWIYFEAAL